MSAVPSTDLRLISLELLDPPPLAMRENIDEAYLDELTVSIRENGLIQPIVVRARGVRFEIIAGHCRSIACRRAGLFSPPCRVVDATDDQVEAMKVAENSDRADVNPADEASWLAALLEGMCSNDFERLASVTKRSPAYLNARLDLLRGLPLVLEALRAGSIGLSVAGELNRFKDPIAAKMHLDQAVQHGATQRMVKQWRREYENFAENNAAAIAAGDAAGSTSVPTASVMPICVVCQEDRDVGELQYIPVHQSCNKAVLKRLLRSLNGEQAI